MRGGHVRSHAQALLHPRRVGPRQHAGRIDGKLFIDYLGRIKRDMIIRKFVKARRAEQLV